MWRDDISLWYDASLVADHRVVDSFGVESMIVLAIVGGCFELSQKESHNTHKFSTFT